MASASQRLPTQHATFIGRDRELVLLRQRLKAAGRGEGGVVLIAGEPGIGKTRLLLEIAAEAGASGWQVLLGHAYDSQQRHPYLPLVEALQDYMRTCDPAELRQQIGDGAREVALILPEAQRRLGVKRITPGNAARGATLNPETERYRLFESVSDFVLAISGAAPSGLLLCLEDLHWADDASLGLLEHLTRRLANARILIVGTYRDTDLQTTLPLAGTLERFARGRESQTISLTRFSKAEVASLLATFGNASPPGALVEAMFIETEGNPFFVREVFEHLADEGRLFDRQGEWRLDFRPEETDVPQNVRLVIGRRLDRLSGECRHVLALGSILGRSFDYELLRTLAASQEDALLAAVEEAEQARLISSTASGQVTFVHELIRQTLLTSLSPLRRLQMHGRAAEAIEELFSENPEAHAPALVEHYAQAGDAPSNLAKVLRYSEAAAAQALIVFGYGEAVHHLEQALKAQETLAPADTAKRCDLLLALADALCEAGDPRRVLDEVAPAALALAEEANDRRSASDACQAAIQASNALGPLLAWGSPVTTRWLELADRYAPENSLARVWTDIALGLNTIRSGRRREGRQFLERARRLSRHLDDLTAIWAADVAYINGVTSPQLEVALLALSQDLAGRSLAGTTPFTRRPSLIYRQRHFLIAGRREDVDLAARDMQALAEETHQPNSEMMAALMSGVMLVLDGRLEEAIEQGDQIHARILGELGIPQYESAVAEWYARPALYLGRLDVLGQMTNSGCVFWREFLAAVRGQFEVAPAFLDGAVRERLKLDPSEDETAVRDDMALLEMAILTRHKAGAEFIVRRYEPWGLVTSGHGGFGPVSIARLLGEACAMLGRPDDARRHLDRALDDMTAMRFRPEAALVRLALASLLLQDFPDERAAAYEYLDAAIIEFEAMKMSPALKHALRLRGRRRRVAAPESPPSAGGLTEREMEVLRLVAAGKSSRQIAEELVLSVRTVDRHIANIYLKTETHGRAQVTNYARDNGLY